MKTLYLDCFAGASGDMLIGALLDCGLDFELLRRELKWLGMSGYELSLSRVDQSGISAAKFDVLLPDGKTDHPREHAHSHSHEHHHEHHDHHHDHEHHEHAHRPLSEIKRLIATSSLSDQVKAHAQAIFERIGAAEAKIHGIPVEQVYFHEVGAVDSIVDIVGACIGLEALQIGRIVSSPLHVGSGTFTCAHGTYPVPGPATTELLRGAPIYSGEIKGELVTPTGAAIISTLAVEYGPLPLMRVERIGYGAGARKYPRFPNVLRAVIGEVETADETPTTVTVIEANIDDLNAQVFGHLMEQALTAGALDIFYTPVQMKKNRPGVLLTLLCAPSDRMGMTELIFRETTTLGVRWREERREILRREHITVETAYGQIRLKLGRASDGRIVNSAPEFDDCRAAAEKHNVAVREIQMAALTAFAQKDSQS
jgi:hypothetical protein